MLTDLFIYFDSLKAAANVGELHKTGQEYGQIDRAFQTTRTS